MGDNRVFIPREEVMQWIRQTVEELRKKNLTQKMMKRTILTTVRYFVICQ